MTKFKLYSAFYYLAILIPFVTIIFFIRTSTLLIILPILFLALITLVISTIALIKNEQDLHRKKYYRTTAIMAVVFFVLLNDFQLMAADWIFFKFREHKLSIFISEIKKYDKIYEMSDGESYWKTVNIISIEPKIADVDTINEFRRKYFLDDVLKREGIDKKHYEFLRKLLIETNLTGFTKLDDGTFSFTIDGFLDNCYGIAYSETGENPCDNYSGRIIRWIKIGTNWYAWSTT